MASFTSYAADYSVFVLRDVGQSPRWYASAANDDRYVFTADLLESNYLRINVNKSRSLADGDQCPTGHVLARKKGIEDADFDQPSASGNTCRYQFDIDSADVVQPGPIVFWTSVQTGFGDQDLDERRVLIRELESLSVTHRSGAENTIINQDAFADGTLIELVNPSDNILEMKLSIYDGLTPWPLWEKRVSGSSIKLPNAILCRVTNTRPLSKLIVVNAIERVFENSFTDRTVSRLDTTCTTKALQ